MIIRNFQNWLIQSKSSIMLIGMEQWVCFGLPIYKNSAQPMAYCVFLLYTTTFISV